MDPPIVLILIALWLIVVQQRDTSLSDGFQKANAHWAMKLYHFEPQ